jgi:hypothetical protein
MIIWKDKEGKKNKKIKENLRALISEVEIPNKARFHKIESWERMKEDNNFEYNLNLLRHMIKKHAVMQRSTI